MQNTIAGEVLRGFIDRIERVREEKDALTDDEKAIFAEAKAAGFSPKYIRAVLVVRKQKPADRQEDEAMMDMYLTALGLAKETPLFKHVGAMSVDLAAKEQVIEAFKTLVPTSGEIIIKMGGAGVRLYRDKDGEPQAEDVIEPEPEDPAPPPRKRRQRPKEDVPDCTEAEAFELGAQAAKDNKPVIDNPFPWDDTRRPKWDEGWRSEAGSDGMGPQDDDDEEA